MFILLTLLLPLFSRILRFRKYQLGVKYRTVVEKPTGMFAGAAYGREKTVAGGKVRDFQSVNRRGQTSTENRKDSSPGEEAIIGNPESLR